MDAVVDQYGTKWFKCAACGRYVVDDQMMYLNAAGEPTIMQLKMYGTDFILCPHCSINIYEQIYNSSIASKVNENNNIMQLQNDIEKYRKIKMTDGLR